MTKKNIKYDFHYETNSYLCDYELRIQIVITFFQPMGIVRDDSWLVYTSVLPRTIEVLASINIYKTPYHQS